MSETDSPGPRVLFATAELRPLVAVGGLGEAASGLVAALPSAGVDVITVLPGYRYWELDDEKVIPLDGIVPGGDDGLNWLGPLRARIGQHPDLGALAIIEADGLERPHPYVDETGLGWPDNTERFARFSVGVAALARALEQSGDPVDVVHLNDWHTALAPPFLPDGPRVVVTIHNLAHQGWAGPEWIHRLPALRHHYQWGDAVNALAGAMRSADAVVAVSPHYAEEIRQPQAGMGLDVVFAEDDVDLVGILNGIDTRVWDPSNDPHTAAFDAQSLVGKDDARARLHQHVGWDDTGDPLVVMVTRLVEQKGIDLAFEAARFLPGLRARLIVLGSGDAGLADWARWRVEQDPDRFAFHDGYDEALAHLLFAGGDLLLMPSRFEPCGLAQMQAMAYGTIPVVTPVGGLVDTVLDADGHPLGTGFVAADVDEAAVVDGLHRAVRAWRHPRRRRAIQRRGMRRDWSWAGPAAEFADLYRRVAARTS